MEEKVRLDLKPVGWQGLGTRADMFPLGFWKNGEFVFDK